MYYMIDNYDSFVYNLSSYFLENGQEILVRRADAVSLEEIHNLHPEGIILSPGPKRPQDATISHDVLNTFQGKIPILGVCLGHQLIGYHYGAQVCKGPSPIHGKTSLVHHDNAGLFLNLPNTFRVTRYHSLIVSETDFPSSLKITARSEDGVIMGIAHRYLPVYGVQFHPEAVLTQYGHELLQNFHLLCKRWNSMLAQEVL